MSLDKLNNLIGIWTGDNVLHLSWMNPPEFHSPSELKIRRAVRDKFLTLITTGITKIRRTKALLLVGLRCKKGSREAHRGLIRGIQARSRCLYQAPLMNMEQWTCAAHMKFRIIPIGAGELSSTRPKKTLCKSYV
jgi:hypothetical protein